MKFNRWKWFLVPFVIAFVSLSGLVIYASENKDKTVEQFIASDDFFGMFKQARKYNEPENKNVYPLSAAVTQYLNFCCPDRDSALALLRREGFEISKNIVDAGAGGGIKYDYREQGYDEVYLAEKYTNFRVFYPVWTENRVVLYMKNGSFVKIVASTYRDAL